MQTKTALAVLQKLNRRNYLYIGWIATLLLAGSVQAAERVHAEFLQANCQYVKTLENSSDGGQSDMVSRGAYSCLDNFNDKETLKDMYKMIRSKYGIRNKRQALRDTVALLNLTGKYRGVQCADGAAGLECRYTDNRGKSHTEKFPAITANYANQKLDNIVSTAAETKWNLNSSGPKSLEEKIAALEKQVNDLEKQSAGCGCQGSNNSSEDFTSDSRSPASSKSTQLNSYIKRYGPKSKGGIYYQVKKNTK